MVHVVGHKFMVVRHKFNLVGHNFMVLRHKFNLGGHNFMVLRHKFNVVGQESSMQDFKKTTNAPLKRTSAQYCSRWGENECSRSGKNEHSTAQDPARTRNKPKAAGIHHSTFARIKLYCSNRTLLCSRVRDTSHAQLGFNTTPHPPSPPSCFQHYHVVRVFSALLILVGLEPNRGGLS